MIKANELRIGNIVSAKSKLTKSNDNLVIDSIGEDGININWAHELTDYEYKLEEIEPIRLTEEWIEKFGFTMSAHRYVKGEYTLLAAHNGFMFGKSNLPIIKDGLRYVHQLQNIYFAVTGEELTIKETQAS